MHVLIVSTGYPTDYVPLDGIFYRDQAEALVAQGNTVGFIAVNPISIKSILQRKKLNLGLSSFTEKGVNTMLYKYINIPKFPVYQVVKAQKKGSALIDNYIAKYGKPDVVHLHCYEGILMAMHLKNKYKIPFVVTEHSSRFMNNSVPASMEKYAELAFRESAYNISVSEKFAEVLHEKYKREFHYVPNIVNTDFYTPGKRPEKEFTFLSAGILNDNKNHVLLIGAFSRFLKSGKTAKLMIAGNGPNMESLKAQALGSGIGKNVVFTGWLPREKLAEMMQQANVFVLPSKKETFGVVLIEAMSCGLPVISTKSGGPESIITSAKTGILCDFDPQALYLAMQEVYDNFAGYDPDEIRQLVLDNYSQKAVSEKLLRIYTDFCIKK